MLCLYAVVILFVVVLCGCRKRSSAPYTRAKPRVTDLVGVWRLNAASRKDVPKRIGKRPVLTEVILRADGTFSIADMPKRPYTTLGRTQGFYSASGTWELLWWMKSQWIVALWYDSFDGRVRSGEKIPGLPQGMMNIRGDSPPYVLDKPYGDADLPHWDFFERTSGDPNAGQATRPTTSTGPTRGADSRPRGHPHTRAPSS